MSNNMTDSIHSFAFRAYTSMLSSNFFYPSNCKELILEDKGSLVESVGNYGLRVTLPVPHHIVNKCLRAFARAIGVLVINLTAAPIGTLYHGSRVIYHCIKRCMVVDTDKETQKIKAHSRAFKIDLIVTLLFLVVGGCSMPGLPLKTAVAIFARVLFTASLSLGAAAPDKYTHYIMELAFASTEELQPDSGGISLEKKNPASVLASSIILKNHFGVVSKGGKLLSYSISLDGGCYAKLQNLKN